LLDRVSTPAYTLMHRQQSLAGGRVMGGRLWIVVMVLLCGVGLGIASVSAAADDSSAWQAGEIRDFTPTTTTLRGNEPVTRSPGSTLTLGETLVYRPKLNPGDQASLRAHYSVALPTGTISVKETRIIAFDGSVLKTLDRVATRSSGVVGSEYQLRIPPSAAEGWYTVTTSIEPVSVTRGSSGPEQTTATFYVEPAPATGQKPPLGTSANTDRVDDGVTLKLWADKPRYKVGDTLTVHFEANRDGYLTLVNVGTSGKVTILFPNRFSGGHEVKGGRAYSIPAPGDGYELAVSAPAGVELIYGLVTTRRMNFVETDFSRTRAIFRSVIGNVEILTRDINAVAKQVPLKERAKALLEVEVVP
jgi:Domain of unknown function (DUF4384)